MWIDSMFCNKLTTGSVTSPDGSYIKCIETVEGGSFVAETSNGVVLGNGNDFATATGWSLIPGQRVEGNFVKLKVVSGVILYYTATNNSRF